MYPSSKIALLPVTGMRQLVKGWTVEPYIGQCLKYDNAWSQTTCPSAITSIARDDDIARNLQLDETINNFKLELLEFLPLLGGETDKQPSSVKCRTATTVLTTSCIFATSIALPRVEAQPSTREGSNPSQEEKIFLQLPLARHPLLSGLQAPDYL
ncbi:hypothetical protein CCR75_007884 [Bremia lactucae]|uniref:Uncharacterized protein n=1 Tax=Bremia lactucae TaxID=4779 RepID=A0A976FMS6_BRELC|nr:hypothetical protein CCR75_007884 [Bremia lactucae]